MSITGSSSRVSSILRIQKPPSRPEDTDPDSEDAQKLEESARKWQNLEESAREWHQKVVTELAQLRHPKTCTALPRELQEEEEEEEENDDDDDDDEDEEDDEEDDDDEAPSAV
jgi:hypothetical protein